MIPFAVVASLSFLVGWCCSWQLTGYRWLLEAKALSARADYWLDRAVTAEGRADRAERKHYPSHSLDGSPLSYATVDALIGSTVVDA